MLKVVIPKDFKKMLSALGRSDRVGKQAAQKAEAACTQAQVHGEIRLPRTKHGESRLDCEKFDLGDGYRLVMQKVGSGADANLIMLFVGTHAESDTWLSKHKNYTWVKRESDGKLDFIQVTSTDEERPPVQVEVSINTPEHLLDEPLLSRILDEDLSNAGFGRNLIERLRKVTKGEWGESSNDFLDELERAHGIEIALLALDVLEMCDHGDNDGARQRLLLEFNQAHKAQQAEVIEAISDSANSEEFFTWSEEENMPAPSDREEWMLYLHPEQAKIAFSDLAGPARLRGVSGSGKTCVLVHRARFLAKKYNEPVLVVSLTSSMKKLLEELVVALCGPERALIKVATVSSLAKDVVRDMHPEGERWYTMTDQRIKSEALEIAARTVKSELSRSTQSLGRLPPAQLRQFLDDEFGFLRTRLLPSEYAKYTSSLFSRVGRGQALTEPARQAVLKGLYAYERHLRDLLRLDDEGIAQVAVRVVQELGEQTNKLRWRAVLADEVQDLSQNEIRLLAHILTRAGEPLKSASDGLFLVGDGAQTVYKRGFSLRSLGIQLSRSIVFKKNYRNTYEILQAAYALIQNHEFADTDEDNRQKPQAPDFAARRGERPKLVRCRNITGEIDYAISVIESVRELRGDSALGDICLISRVPPIRDELARKLKLNGIPCTNIKENAPLNSPGVRISTIESAKGFEFGVVILAGASETINSQQDADTGSNETDSDAAKLYVAMTRARDSLHITYTSNVEREPAKALNSISQWCDEVRFESGKTLSMR
jgi:superfamily I DNA/RNA helicase